MEQIKQEADHSRCIVCRRRLKDPQARRNGMGEKCRKKYEKRRGEKVTQIEFNF